MRSVDAASSETGSVWGCRLYQRAKMLTHHVLEMRKRRTGLTNAR
jgi:hypothetical protein